MNKRISLSIIIALVCNTASFCSQAQVKRAVAKKGAGTAAAQKKNKRGAQRAAGAQPASQRPAARALAPARKYAIAKYDPSQALNTTISDKLEVLNDATQDTITTAVRAYFKNNPAADKQQAIDGFINTFEQDHFKTYQRHYLTIGKPRGKGNKEKEEKKAQESFAALLARTKIIIEDEHISCCCVQ